MQTTIELLRNMAGVYHEQLSAEQLRVYLERIERYPYSLVKMAIDNWIDSSKWFPKVSELLDTIRAIQSSNPKPLMLLCDVGAGLREAAIQAEAANYWNAIWEWDGHMKRCGVCTDKSLATRSKPKALADVMEAKR